ncbi:adenylyltransferase/cytidyltransferase family protein [Caulobacter segnis]
MGSLMRYDYLVLIGRFQPFHNGHLAVLRHALRLADKVIVLVGSAGQPAPPAIPSTPASAR